MRWSKRTRRSGHAVNWKTSTTPYTTNIGAQTQHKAGRKAQRHRDDSNRTSTIYSDCFFLQEVATIGGATRSSLLKLGGGGLKLAVELRGLNPEIRDTINVLNNCMHAETKRHCLAMSTTKSKTHGHLQLDSATICTVQGSPYPQRGHSPEGPPSVCTKSSGRPAQHSGEECSQRRRQLITRSS